MGLATFRTSRLIALLALGYCAAPLPADASIIRVPLALDEAIPTYETAMAAVSVSCEKSGAFEILSDELAGDRHPDPQLTTIFELMRAHQSGSTTSTSSGSTSTTLPNGTTPMTSECVSIAAADGGVKSLAAERALLLPAAPGKDIFHPPRNGS